MMQDSFPFPIFSGLLTAEHRKKIGSALWEFHWCISKTTKEVDGEDGKVGLVLGGRPIKLSEIAAEFEIDEKTVSRNLKRLAEHGYIELTRAPYGYVIKVKRSKKFILNRSDKNVRSVVRDQTKMSDLDQTKMSDQTNLSDPDRTKMSERSDTSVRCNKDIKDIKVTTMPPGQEENEISPEQSEAINRVTELWQEIKQVIFVPNADLNLIHDLVINKKIPADTIIEAVKQSYEQFKIRNQDKPWNKIRSFSYFTDAILALHHEKTNPSKMPDNVTPFPKKPSYWEEQKRREEETERKRLEQRDYQIKVQKFIDAGFNPMKDSDLLYEFLEGRITLNDLKSRKYGG